MKLKLSTRAILNSARHAELYAEVAQRQFEAGNQELANSMQSLSETCESHIASNLRVAF